MVTGSFSISSLRLELAQSDAWVSSKARSAGRQANAGHGWFRSIHHGICLERHAPQLSSSGKRRKASAPNLKVGPNASTSTTRWRRSTGSGLDRGHQKDEGAMVCTCSARSNSADRAPWSLG